MTMKSILINNDYEKYSDQQWLWKKYSDQQWLWKNFFVLLVNLNTKNTANSLLFLAASDSWDQSETQKKLFWKQQRAAQEALKRPRMVAGPNKHKHRLSLEWEGSTKRERRCLSGMADTEQS